LRVAFLRVAFLRVAFFRRAAILGSPPCSFARAPGRPGFRREHDSELSHRRGTCRSDGALASSRRPKSGT
jgi:hypothetical protein